MKFNFELLQRTRTDVYERPTPEKKVEKTAQFIAQDLAQESHTADAGLHATIVEELQRV